MSLPVLDLITGLFYSTFGNGLIMALAIISFFLMALVVMKANLSVILMVLLPLIVGIVLSVAQSNFIEIPAWIVIVIVMLMGVLFSLFFFIFTR